MKNFLAKTVAACLLAIPLVVVAQEPNQPSDMKQSDSMSHDSMKHDDMGKDEMPKDKKKGKTEKKNKKDKKRGKASDGMKNKNEM